MQHRRNDADEAGGVDFPQAFPDEAPRKVKVEGRQRKRKLRGGDSEGGGNWIASFGLLMAIVLVASYFLVSHHEQRQLEHLRQDIIHEQVEPLSRDWEEKYSALEEENQRLKREAKEIASLKAENTKMKQDSGSVTKRMEDSKKKMEQLTKYKETMQANIQLLSKTLLLEK